MSEWIIKCRVTTQGADCYVRAATAKEAIDKFHAGKWHYLDTDLAETVDWTMMGEPELNE